MARLWGAALAAAAAAWGVKLLVLALHPIVGALLILATFGAAYLAAVSAMGVPEAGSAVGRIAGRIRGSRGAR
jgi:hypothetical protein